ncbi:MAG: hypothetical protein U0T81_06990 [Saprospiraceae bacterium]
MLSRIRVDTEQQFGYEHILGQFKKLVDQLKSATGINPEVIGVGTPGAIDLYTKK